MKKDISWNKIKSETKADIIVDAVQAPGKIAEWKELNDKLDAYSFSSHKFGGLKGIGFSFVKDSYDYSPLIIGGGQQNQLLQRIVALDSQGALSI